MTTVCATCAHVKILPGDKDRHWLWMCQCAPLPAWTNPVTGNTAADPPFQQCRKINLGECPMYEAGPTPINPRETNDGNA